MNQYWLQSLKGCASWEEREDLYKKWRILTSLNDALKSDDALTLPERLEWVCPPDLRTDEKGTYVDIADNRLAEVNSVKYRYQNWYTRYRVIDIEDLGSQPFLEKGLSKKRNGLPRYCNFSTDGKKCYLTPVPNRGGSLFLIGKKYIGPFASLDTELPSLNKCQSEYLCEIALIQLMDAMRSWYKVYPNWEDNCYREKLLENIRRLKAAAQEYTLYRKSPIVPNGNKERLLSPNWWERLKRIAKSCYRLAKAAGWIKWLIPLILRRP